MVDLSLLWGLSPLATPFAASSCIPGQQSLAYTEDLALLEQI